MISKINFILHQKLVYDVFNVLSRMPPLEFIKRHFYLCMRNRRHTLISRFIYIHLFALILKWYDLITGSMKMKGNT